MEELPYYILDLKSLGVEQLIIRHRDSMDELAKLTGGEAARIYNLYQKQLKTDPHDADCFIHGVLVGIKHCSLSRVASHVATD